jgi:Bacteriophage clamp loader A subunit
MNPFEFIKDLSHVKVGLLNEDNEGDFVPYLTNRAFSLFLDSIICANKMNLNSHLDKRMQYDYYLYSLRKTKRYAGKWPKQEYSDELKAVAEYHNQSFREAKETLSILTEEQIKRIKEWHDSITQ